jgi:hypothetical protein
VLVLMYEYNCRGGDVVQHCVMSSAAAQQALAQTVSRPIDMHSTCMHAVSGDRRGSISVFL